MRGEDDEPGGGEAQSDVEAEGSSTDGGARRVGERYGVEETPDGDLLLATVTGDWQWLIEALASGADVNAVDRRYGWPMLYWAAQKKMSVSVVLLLEAGADKSARGFERETPLHAAARWGDLGSIAALVKGGAEVDGVDERGRTPLNHAAYYGRFLASYLLLALGADPTIRSTGRGARSACEAATKRGHPEIAKLLGGAPLGKKGEELLRQYGFVGVMVEDAGRLDELMARHVVAARPKPLRAEDVHDRHMQRHLWRMAEREKPPEERYGYIVRHKL